MLKKCSQCVHASAEDEFGARLCVRSKEFCIDERLWDEATGACGRSAQFFEPRPSDIEAAPAMRVY